MLDCPEVAAEHKDSSSLGRNPPGCSKARYYNPGIGRFISEDKLNRNKGKDLYVYVLNNPTNSVDPMGLNVLNLSPCVIYVKPEHGDNAVSVAPWGSYNERQDGIAIPGIRDQVYKTSNFVDAVVIGKTIIPVGLGVPLQPFLGGWKDLSFLNELHKKTPPDNGWDDLFAKSKLQQDCCE